MVEEVNDKEDERRKWKIRPIGDKPAESVGRILNQAWGQQPRATPLEYSNTQTQTDTLWARTRAVAKKRRVREEETKKKEVQEAEKKRVAERSLSDSFSSDIDTTRWKLGPEVGVSVKFQKGTTERSGGRCSEMRDSADEPIQNSIYRTVKWLCADWPCTLSL